MVYSNTYKYVINGATYNIHISHIYMIKYVKKDIIYLT